MANVLAIRSFTSSLATWLTNRYAAADIPAKPNFTFGVVSSSQLAAEDGPGNDPLQETDRVTLYLYRTTMDPHLRGAGRSLRPDMNPVPLSLQAHLLFTVWTTNAGFEHVLLAWLLRTLHEHPIFDASSLDFDADWAADDLIHLIPEELSVEDMCRIWDALTPSYRLSVSYVARVIRIDPETPSREGAPVVAQQFQYRNGREPVQP